MQFNLKLINKLVNHKYVYTYEFGNKLCPLTNISRSQFRMWKTRIGSYQRRYNKLKILLPGILNCILCRASSLGKILLDTTPWTSHGSALKRGLQAWEWVKLVSTTEGNTLLVVFTNIVLHFKLQFYV